MTFGCNGLNLHLFSFTGCLMSAPLSSGKEIGRLISKETSIFYLKVTLTKSGFLRF